jgi:hypothetical protein
VLLLKFGAEGGGPPASNSSWKIWTPLRLMLKLSALNS